MDGYPSGQRGLTVNQLATRLRRFESFTVHSSGAIVLAPTRQALIAQLVERALGKGEVMGSIPIEGSKCRVGNINENEKLKERNHGQAEI